MLVKTNIVGFNTIVIREFNRIVRIWGQTIVPPAITATLYFIIFGSLIGRRIGEAEHGRDVAPALEGHEEIRASRFHKCLKADV